VEKRREGSVETELGGGSRRVCAQRGNGRDRGAANPVPAQARRRGQANHAAGQSHRRSVARPRTGEIAHSMLLSLDHAAAHRNPLVMESPPFELSKCFVRPLAASLRLDSFNSAHDRSAACPTLMVGKEPHDLDRRAISRPALALQTLAVCAKAPPSYL
jgi:hypothetical protein